MSARKTTARCVAALALALSLSGCGGVPLEPDVPAAFDLGGRWVLLDVASDSAPDRHRLRARGGMLSFVTQDFPVLRATELEIEQGPDSMGISYDGDDYRDVSWGERRRGLWEVRAGWNEGRLLILSKASDADAEEVFTLSPDGSRLTIDTRIRATGDTLAVRRVFGRR
ncbi:MAG: hypothetical protein RIB46_14000 [Pseudomonadales bacterium]